MLIGMQVISINMNRNLRIPDLCVFLSGIGNRTDALYIYTTAKVVKKSVAVKTFFACADYLLTFTAYLLPLALVHVGAYHLYHITRNESAYAAATRDVTAHGQTIQETRGIQISCTCSINTFGS